MAELSKTSAKKISNAICDKTAPNATAQILISFFRRITKNTRNYA